MRFVAFMALGVCIGAGVAPAAGKTFHLDGYVADEAGWSATVQVTMAQAQDCGYGNVVVPVQLDYAYPQILSPLDAHARAFNEGVKAEAAKLWHGLANVSQATANTDTCEDVGLGFAYPAEDAELGSSDLAPSLPGVISLQFVLADYTHGAAHSEWGNVGFNWDMAANRELRPADIFKAGDGWKQAVIKAAYAAFGNVIHSLVGPDMEAPMEETGTLPGDEAEKDFTDPSDWLLSAKGLEIISSVYELCPYSCGTPSATIPWSALKPYLKPGGLAP